MATVLACLLTATTRRDSPTVDTIACMAPTSRQPRLSSTGAISAIADAKSRCFAPHELDRNVQVHRCFSHTWVPSGAAREFLY
jgi:hypothetical protein